MKQFTLLALVTLLALTAAQAGNSKQFSDTIVSERTDKADGLLDPKSLTKCAGEIDRFAWLRCFDKTVAAWVWMQMAASSARSRIESDPA